MFGRYEYRWITALLRLDGWWLAEAYSNFAAPASANRSKCRDTNYSHWYQSWGQVREVVRSFTMKPAIHPHTCTDHRRGATYARSGCGQQDSVAADEAGRCRSIAATQNAGSMRAFPQR